MSLKRAPYGFWESPVTTDLITQKATKVDDVLVDSLTSKSYLVEGRPDEGGRNAIVDISSGQDIFGREYNARTTAQEYGGASAIIVGDVAYFSRVPENEVYKIDLKNGSSPTQITPDNKNWRYANFSAHPQQPHLLVSVLEDHTKPEPSEVLTRLVVINAKKKTVTTLVDQADFYSSPLVSPDGKHISFVQWFHPDMPWEGGEIVVTTLAITSDGEGLEIGKIGSPIAGKRAIHAASQPEWLSNDTILYTSDETGYLNPYIYSLSKGSSSAIFGQPVKEDFGEPAWIYGNSCYAILTATTALFTSISEGRATLYKIDLTNGELHDLKTPYVDITRVRKVSEDVIVFKGKKSDEAEAMVQYTLSSNTYTVLKATSNIIDALPKGSVAIGQPHSFPIPGTSTFVHAIFYPPTNPAYEANTDEKPPCIVGIHGGPTSRTTPGLEWSKQFFTSRGFAWVDVNYGGSSGYGTAYINRLRGQWGIVDVEDTVQAVNQIAEKNLIDPKRVAIRGGSAGGFTVLSALTSQGKFFATGNSLFGVSDVAMLNESTHKFESRYLERLIGGTAKDKPDLYKERSPVFHADNIKVPILIQQGADDKVVPPDQAKSIVDIIQNNKGTVKYIEYAGEGHGWRKAETIKTALEAELLWYREQFQGH